ncbi:MAG TPA: hypothetical protein VGO09_08905, partial [Flavisolibacter sp.]|nr:hypothetical protein [Flavisolibacter sp.]
NYFTDAGAAIFPDCRFLDISLPVTVAIQLFLFFQPLLVFFNFKGEIYPIGEGYLSFLTNFSVGFFLSMSRLKKNDQA